MLDFLYKICRIVPENKYRIAVETLKIIDQFGKENSGRGFTCHRMAELALKELEE